jgi:HAMP domain-containing protein
MNHSIRAKVVLITVALLVFAIGMNAAASGYVLTSKVTQALQSETLVIGQTLRLQLDKLLRLGIPVENLVGFEEQCQDVVAEHENISYAMVVDADGTILFHNDPAQHGTVLTDSAVLEAVQSTENTFRAYSSQGKRYYDAIIPVLGIHGEHIAAVRIGFPAKLVAEETRGLVVHTVGVAVLSLGVATALLIYGLSSWVTNPLMTLLTVIQEIRREGTTGLTRRVTIDSEDEIGHLASAFNQMIGD